MSLRSEIVTIGLLKELGACKEGIAWAIESGVGGMRIQEACELSITSGNPIYGFWLLIELCPGHEAIKIPLAILQESLSDDSEDGTPFLLIDQMLRGDYQATCPPVWSYSPTSDRGNTVGRSAIMLYQESGMAPKSVYHRVIGALLPLLSAEDLLSILSYTIRLLDNQKS